MQQLRLTSVKTLNCVKTICCYTNVHPQTEAALKFYAPDAQRVCVSGDDFAYWKALAARWTYDDLVIVEHDIVIREDVMRAFSECTSPWCAFPYVPYEYSARGMLGCVRFKLTAQERVSTTDIQRAFGDCAQHGTRTSCWHQLADQVGNAMEIAGFTVCEHYPVVNHCKNLRM